MASGAFASTAFLQFYLPIIPLFVTDSDLQNISELCVSLCDLNLKACTSVTDAGIAALILKCVKLHSIVVCDTSFGQSSVRALCSTIGDFVSAPQNQDSLAYKLQTLHMGGCKGDSLHKALFSF